MTTNKPLAPSVSKETAAGAAVYNRPVLATYDFLILSFSNTYIWRCPSSVILDFYNEHISARHLDVGVGTGYFLDKCAFPTAQPTVALADLNANSLAVTARRLRRYQPAVYEVDVLQPLNIQPAGFASIGINYLLHCLPGAMSDKSVVFQNLKPLLAPEGGVIFGATIMGKDIKRDAFARKLMQIYNARGIFSNREDSPSVLEKILKDNFREYELRFVGCVALFSGKV